MIVTLLIQLYVKYFIKNEKAGKKMMVEVCPSNKIMIYILSVLNFKEKVNNVYRKMILINDLDDPV